MTPARYYIKVLTMVAGIALALVLAWFLRTILLYLVIAAVVALVGRPICNRLEKIKIGKLQFGPTLSAALTLIIFFIGFGLFSLLLIPIILQEVEVISHINTQATIKALQVPLNELAAYLKKYNIEFDPAAQAKLAITRNWSTFLNTDMLSNFFSIFSFVGSFLGGIFVVSFMAFFFLKDSTMTENIILVIMPDKYEEQTQRALTDIKRMLRRYFIGIIIQVSIVSTLYAIGYSIVGVKNAIIIAIMCGVLNTIPYVGQLFSIALAALLTLTTGLDPTLTQSTGAVLGWMLLVFTIVQTIDAALLQPTIFSKSVKAHPLEIFIVILASGQLFGVLGMIAAVPSYTVLRILAREFLFNLKIVQKLTEDM